MDQRVHIHTLEVSGQGQIINFQVRIPRDAHRIVGILITENALTGTFTPPIALPIVIHAAFSPGISPGVAVPAPGIAYPVNVGSVLLQAKNKANFFYQEDILHSGNSFLEGDFSQSNPVFPVMDLEGNAFAVAAVSAPRPADFKGGANYREVCIEVDVTNTKLFGIYTDVINEQRRIDSPYQVRLYFYYQQKRIVSNEN